MNRFPERRRAKERFVALTVGVLAMVAGACGDDAPSPDGRASVATTADPSAMPATARAVQIIATDYGFDLGGASVPAGQVALTLANKGAEDHQLDLVRVDEGVPAADVIAGLRAGDGSGLARTTAVGGPNGVSAGGTGTVTATLAAGTYVMVCHIPSPQDGTSHAQKGMVGSFTVEGADADPAPAAAVKGTITIASGGYSLPAGLSSGSYRVINQLDQPAEAALVRLRPGATAQDVLAFLGGEAPPGPPPFSTAGGITSLAPGASAVADLQLSAGSYVVMSFAPDFSAGGRPQFLSGLLSAVTVS